MANGEREGAGADQFREGDGPREGTTRAGAQSGGLAGQVEAHGLQARIADSLEHIADSLAVIARKLGTSSGPPRQERQDPRGGYPPRRGGEERRSDFGQYPGPRGAGGGEARDRYRRPGRRWDRRAPGR